MAESPHLPSHATPHDDHDELLIAARATDDLAGPELERAEALVAACETCAILLSDLRAVRAATATLPAPRRPHDFRLTVADVERLRARGLRRWTRHLGAPRLQLARPLAAGLTALGLAGLLVTTLPLGGTGGAPAARETAASGAASAPDRFRAGASAAASPAASAAAAPTPPARRWWAGRRGGRRLDRGRRGVRSTDGRVEANGSGVAVRRRTTRTRRVAAGEQAAPARRGQSAAPCRRQTDRQARRIGSVSRSPWRPPVPVHRGRAATSPPPWACARRFRPSPAARIRPGLTGTSPTRRGLVRRCPSLDRGDTASRAERAEIVADPERAADTAPAPAGPGSGRRGRLPDTHGPVRDVRDRRAGIVRAALDRAASRGRLKAPHAAADPARDAPARGPAAVGAAAAGTLSPPSRNPRRALRAVRRGSPWNA